MVEAKTTYPNPNRPPKKYPQKDLHGRARFVGMYYRELHRYLTFYIEVFGWDFFRGPEHGGGSKPDDPNPILGGQSGPSQPDYEGLTPGHMLVSAEWDPNKEGKIAPMSITMEMHSDPDVSTDDTLAEITSHGGEVVFDNSKDPNIQPWARKFAVTDPMGNRLNLWKCTPSRIWGEYETQYDTEE